jgi:hypothetical protein
VTTIVASTTILAADRQLNLGDLKVTTSKLYSVDTPNGPRLFGIAGILTDALKFLDWITATLNGEQPTHKGVTGGDFQALEIGDGKHIWLWDGALTRMLLRDTLMAIGTGSQGVLCSLASMPGPPTPTKFRKALKLVHRYDSNTGPTADIICLNQLRRKHVSKVRTKAH